MKRDGFLLRFFAVITLIFCAFLKNVYAYLDPGSGSYFFQLMVAALLGSAFAVRLFWNRIKDSFIRFFSRKNRHKKNGNQR